MAIKWAPRNGGYLGGTQESDVLFGGAANDVIVSFVDPVLGSGLSSARQSITDRADIILAGAGDDLVMAGGGSDMVMAGAGNDTIDGGPGVDRVWGGAGNDVFLFDVLYASPGSPTPDTGVGPNERDQIMDFRQGQDVIDLRGWENDYGGVLGATFVGQTDITSGSEQLQVGFRHEGNSTIVELSRLWFTPFPGDPVEYFGPVGEIEILGRVNLQASDFIFSG